MFTINPKAIQIGQLFGEITPLGEWHDGIFSNIAREACRDQS